MSQGDGDDGSTPVPQLDSLAQDAAIFSLQRQVSNLTRILNAVMTSNPLVAMALNPEVVKALAEMAEQGAAFEDDLVFAVKNPQEEEDVVP